ncbi:unnamed protein product [Phytophthora lilii]|uniref:Unnamed protein product n=1 Tax=Phytophthora lilii TaxID=2077276 RepID=A0A9W6TTB8_9STRA|nr:unnamed protein product [Phytophthora lilii]
MGRIKEKLRNLSSGSAATAARDSLQVLPQTINRVLVCPEAASFPHFLTANVLTEENQAQEEEVESEGPSSHLSMRAPHPIFAIVNAPMISSMSRESLLKCLKLRKEYKEYTHDRCKDGKEEMNAVMESVKRSLYANVLETLYEVCWGVTQSNVTDEFLLEQIHEVTYGFQQQELPDVREIFRKELKKNSANLDIDARVIDAFEGELRTIAGFVHIAKPVKCLIIPGDSGEFLLGNDLLLSLGIDADRQIDMLAVPLGAGTDGDEFDDRQWTEPRCRIYPPEVRWFLEEFNNKLVELGWVYENRERRWASPVLPVKLSGEFRQTADYKPVNALEAVVGIMPDLQSDLEAVKGAAFFGLFDFVKGYWQLALAEECQEMLSNMTHNIILYTNTCTARTHPRSFVFPSNDPGMFRGVVATPPFDVDRRFALVCQRCEDILAEVKGSDLVLCGKSVVALDQMVELLNRVIRGGIPAGRMEALPTPGLTFACIYVPTQSDLEAYYRRQSYGNPGVPRSSARAPDPATPRYPDLDPGRSAFESTTLAEDSSTKAYCQYSAGSISPRRSASTSNTGSRSGMDISGSGNDFRKEDQERKPPHKATPRPDPDLGRQTHARVNRFGSGLTGSSVEVFHAAPTHSLVSPRRSRPSRTRTSLESPREQDPAHTDGYTR